MCLGAIYWARLARIYFANFTADAAKIGFDDSFIHRQLAKPVSERTIPMVQMMRKPALAAFHAWQNRGGQDSLLRASLPKPWDKPRPFCGISLAQTLGKETGKSKQYGSIEKILAPLVVRASHEPHDVTAGVEIERPRLTHQLHSSLTGKLVSLATITGMTTGHQVLPGGSSGPRTRDYVIERQIARWQHFGAVLAGIAVTQQNVLPRKSPCLVGNAPVFEQPDYRGQSDRETCCMEKVAILFLGNRRTLENQDNRTSGGADIDGLVGGIQHQYGSMENGAVAFTRPSGRDRRRPFWRIWRIVPFP